jgi:hypothetical protein
MTRHPLKISRQGKAAGEGIPGSIDNYVTGVAECSQRRHGVKDDEELDLFHAPQQSLQPLLPAVLLLSQVMVLAFQLFALVLC